MKASTIAALLRNLRSALRVIEEADAAHPVAMDTGATCRDAVEAAVQLKDAAERLAGLLDNRDSAMQAELARRFQQEGKA